jgi:hypothetical protein
MAAEGNIMLAHSFWKARAIRAALAAAALATLFAAAPAFAQTANVAPEPPAGATAPAPDADNDRADAAWADFLETEGAILADAQFAALNNLAFQAAAVRVCDGHSLAKETFGKAIGDVIASGDKELSDEDAEARKTAILVAFGARYGLFIAEAHGDKADFCTAAAKLKAEPDGTPVFLE